MRRRRCRNDRGSVRASARVRTPSPHSAWCARFQPAGLRPGLWPGVGGEVHRRPVRAGATRRPRSKRCSASQAIRILRDKERRPASPRGERDFKRVLGGLLAPVPRLGHLEDREGMDSIACGEPSEELWGDLAVRLARLQARRLERNRARERSWRPSGSAAARRAASTRSSLALEKAHEHGHDRRRRRARFRRVLPVSRRPAGRARCRRDGDHPAGRLEARRRSHRSGTESRRDDGPDRPPPLPALAPRAPSGAAIR